MVTPTKVHFATETYVGRVTRDMPMEEYAYDPYSTGRKREPQVTTHIDVPSGEITVMVRDGDRRLCRKFRNNDHAQFWIASGQHLKEWEHGQPKSWTLVWEPARKQWSLNDGDDLIWFANATDAMAHLQQLVDAVAVKYQDKIKATPDEYGGW